MISKKAAIIGGIVIIVITTFFASFLTLQISRYIDVQQGDRIIISKEEYLANREFFQQIDKVKTDLEDSYLYPPDEGDMMYGAIHGMVDAVADGHTYFMSPDEFETFTERNSSTYQGIGVVVQSDKDDGLITIVRVFDGGPAMQAGLAVGDKIVGVDGVAVTGDDMDTAIDMIKGLSGTEVTISIQRGNEVTEYTLERAYIEVPDLESRMIGDIGYIWLFEFDDMAAENFNDAVADLSSQGMKGLVLDLRGNPGGYLHSCTEIADTLLPEGLIVTRVDRKGNEESAYSDKESLGIPLVVIINEYSASASELLSGAIQDYGVGTIVGVTSYGKGTVQTTRYYEEDGSALYFTIAHYITPSGRSVDGIGITPDVEVEVSQEAIDYVTNNPDADLPQEMDNQLQQALSVLRLKMGK
jgi:carboxyl-terminal processing protease